MKRKLIYALTFVVFFAIGCKKDFSVIEDWKETMVIYALLDQTEAVQYVRINKAFLGEGDAFAMATEFDSINFMNSINVRLKANGGSPITLTPDTINYKEAGTFAYPKQIVYSTNAALNPNATYTIEVTNNATGNVATGNTQLVGNIAVEKPFTNQTISLVSPTQIEFIRWRSSNNGRIYQAVVRFNYIEEVIATGQQTNKHIDWVFSQQLSDNSLGGQTMSVNILGADFFKFLNGRRDVLTTDNAVHRYPVNLDFFVYAGSEDLNTYMEVNRPVNSIVQEKPEFTNITNGLGLFAARTHGKVLGRPLSQLSLEELCGGQYTSDLRFCDPSAVPGEVTYCD